MKKLISFFSLIFFLCLSINALAVNNENDGSRASGIPVCDIRILANNAPAGTMWACGSIINTLSTIKNVGTATQTNIKFFYLITGLNGFYDSVTVGSLGPDSTLTVSFGSYPLLFTGTFTVSSRVFVPCDTNPFNDTLTTTFTLIQPNYGGPFMSSNYFFANSDPCAAGAQNQPLFFWEDTTGSTSIIVDTSVQTPSGVFVGNKDNGYWMLEIPGPDPIRFNGVDYDSFFVSTNGMIGLTLTNNSEKMNDFNTVSIPSTAAIQPGIFAFWKDFDFSSVLTGSKRISYKEAATGDGKVLIITYDKAPNFGATLATDYVSFQIIIQVGTGLTDGNIIVQYDDSKTGAEFLEKYNNLLLADHTVGIQDQTGTAAVDYRRVSGVNVTPEAQGPLFSSPLAVAFGTNQNVLPVELLSFTSSVTGNNVNLNWSTTSELGNAGFDIERSVINGQWSTVGNISGNGTSNTSHDYTFTDRGLNSGKYNYRLKQIDLNGNFTYFNLSNEVNIGVPTKFNLSQNYPNPFNPSTKINYELPFDGMVSIKVFDLAGKEVATIVNEVKTADYYTIDFNGANLSSGVYFYRISAEANGQNFVSVKKMMLVK